MPATMASGADKVITKVGRIKLIAHIFFIEEFTSSAIPKIKDMPAKANEMTNISIIIPGNLSFFLLFSLLALAKLSTLSFSSAYRVVS